jgi:thiamine biosynthesis lipoprotein
MLPAPRQLEDARRLVGWQLVKLDRTARKIELTVPGMLLDLGGIAKGYAGDEALRVLRERGISSALFEAGGDIVVAGAPPDRPHGWQVETIDTGSGRRRLGVVQAAVSTSGDTEQYVAIDGVRFSHVIDPHTGIGLTQHAMATVVARRGITSDSLSTAATVLGPEHAAELCRRFAARAYVRKVGEN